MHNHNHITIINSCLHLTDIIFIIALVLLGYEQ